MPPPAWTPWRVTFPATPTGQIPCGPSCGRLASPLEGCESPGRRHAGLRSTRRLWAPWPALPPRVGDLGHNVGTAGEEFRDWLAFLYPFNCTGQPAISLPLARSAAGLPIGVQLVGAPHDEYTILSLAAQIESSEPSPPPPPTAATVSGHPTSR